MNMDKILIKEMLNDSFWIMPATPTFTSSGVPYITSKNIKAGGIQLDNAKFISQEDYNSIAKNRPIKVNDILISMIGTLGEAAIVKSEYGVFYGQNVYLLRINDKVLNHKFFLFFMNSLTTKRHLESKMNQSTQRYLKAEHIETLEFPNFTIDEQNESVIILDKLSMIINKRKRQIEELDMLIKSRFIEMFGDTISNNKKWVVKQLQEVGSWKSGGTPSRNNKNYFNGDIDWYSAGELNELYLKESVEKITQEAIRESSAKIFNKGSMLVGMYDTAAFKMGILKKDSASNQACANVMPYENVHIIWLYYNLSHMKEHFLRNRRGIRQKNLNLGMIKEFEIPVPPIDFQNQFATFVQQVDKLKVEAQKSLDEMQVLFDSLMQKYFG